MCGDGANDCGALKAAHAGISLSEAEASIASPFTSAEANISCVPHIIREGRAALTTSFGVFKFMVLYSIIEFMSTVILYSINSNLTDFEFLFIDLCLVVQLAFSFGRNRAYSGPLVPEVPLTSLLSLIPLSSLLLQAILMSGIQILSFKLVHLYSWFVPFQYKDATYYISYENYAVFTVGQFQYIIMAFVFSQGAPYREPIYTNKIFFTSMCVMTCVCIYITLTPAEWVKNLLQLRFPPNLNFPIVVLGLAFVNLLLSTFVEMFVVQYVMFKKLRYRNHDLKSSRRKYLAVDQELVLDPEWPPLSSGRVTIGLCQEKLEELGTDNPAFEGDVPNGSKHSTNL